MGIYINHGVEYRVLYKDGTYKTIVNSKESDERLLDSVYYSRRSHLWFNKLIEYVIPIESIDIELYEQEKDKLNEHLNINIDDIIHHGWYDVNSIITSWF